MKHGREDGRGKLWDFIASKSNRHIMLLVGSAVSYSDVCECASVSTICNNIVLEPIATQHPALTTLAEGMRYDGSRREKSPLGSLCRAVAALPFEQFMGCVDAVDSDLAATVIRVSCGGNSRSRPNTNHEWTTAISLALLRGGYCETITVATTNYDECLERTETFQACNLKAEQKGNVWFGSIKQQQGDLRFIKLHGCVTRPSACVFTMKQYARALFDKHFIRDLSSHLGRPNLSLAIGYSFSDPDLRPVWEGLCKSSESSFFLNVKNPDAGDLSAEPSDVLRREFLERLNPEIIHSNLYRSPNAAETNQHVLAFLAQQLGLETRELPVFGTSGDMVGGAADAVRGLSVTAAGEILGRISDSCCRGDARAELEPLMHREEEPTATLVRVFLNQWVHVNNLNAQANAARELRKRYPGTRVELVARAVESFALSVGGGVVGGLRAIPVVLCASKAGLRTSDPQTRCFFDHYRAHLFCKFIQKLGCLIPVALLKCGGRRLLRWMSSRSLPSLRSAVVGTEATITEQLPNNMLLELKDAGSAHHLLAQMLLLSELFEEAKEHAQRSHVYYSCSGVLNGALQIDRVFGWLYLAEKKQNQAIAVLARGLWRALETHDVSLRPKLAADLMRSLGSDMIGVIAPAEPDIHERMKVVARNASQSGSVDSRVLQEYVGVMYPDDHWKRLEKYMRRSLDPALSPIFLPNDPPAPSASPPLATCQIAPI